MKNVASWSNLALPVGPFCQWPTYGVPWIFVYCSRNHYSKACKIAQTFRVIIVLVRSWKFQELHVVSLMPPHRVSPPPKTEKWLKLKKKTREMILCTKNGILFPKLFNCVKKVEQFIRTVKGWNNFRKRLLFPGGFSDLIH